MKRLILSAVAVAGLAAAAAGPASAETRSYPPCSASVRDECIQQQPGAHHAPARGHHHARAHHAH